MLSLLYPISYLSCLTGLILWFYFKDNRSNSRKMNSLFLVSFFVYLFSLAFSDGAVSYKLLILFRDLVILAAISQGFSYVRKYPLVVLIAAVVLYGLVQFIGFNMLYNTFPQIRDSVASPQDEFELLVETSRGQIPDAYQRIIDKFDLTVEKAFDPQDTEASQLDEFVAIGIPDKSEKKIKRIIRELRRLRGTRHIEINEEFSVSLDEGKDASASTSPKYVNDPMAARQWGWQAIQGDPLHERLANLKIKPLKQSRIAILDTGVDAAHEDLADHFVSAGTTNDQDPMGHGTHCAGIAASVSNNQKGIASLLPGSEWVKVTSVKVLGANGAGNQRQTIEGMIKAADMGVDVISMSLGSLSNDSRQKAYNEAVKYARSKGAIVVVAAGNNNINAKGYSPANSSGVITVSALDENFQKASFSNTVEDIKLGIAAPGVNILSTFPKGQYKPMNGTSMATPAVAGLIGLLKAFQPNLTAEEAYEILNETGLNVPGQNKTGKLIQSLDALERVID